MKGRKNEKLLFIAPSGEEYKIGFLSPCAEGLVLGTANVPEGESSHLTILNKEGKISAHITPRNSLTLRQYFPPFSVKEFTDRFHSLVDDKKVFCLSREQLNEDVLYLTRKLKDWFNVLVSAVYQKIITQKEITHIVNFKSLFDQLPKFVEELRNSPQSFFGLCKAQELLNDESRIFGISNSGVLILKVEKELIGLDFKDFANFDFMPSMNKSQLTNPLNRFYESLGINQYIHHEVMEKKFLENLLSKENWETLKMRKEIL